MLIQALFISWISLMGLSHTDDPTTALWGLGNCAGHFTVDKNKLLASFLSGYCIVWSCDLGHFTMVRGN